MVASAWPRASVVSSDALERQLPPRTTFMPVAVPEMALIPGTNLMDIDLR